jgi:hypothetical protein
MKIDPSRYLTVAEAAIAIGADAPRAAYRAIKRATDAGEEVTVELFGRTLVPIEKVDVLKRFYFPYYSEAHQSMVQEWGRRGGSQKAKNMKARSAKRAT